MDRRTFFQLVASTGAYVAISPFVIKKELRADNGNLFKTYERVQLVDKDGKPLMSSKLKKEENYVFNYPHKGTPCFLIDLGEPTNKDIKLKSEDGEEYLWKSGVGKNRSIVAYSAICSHQLAHPTPEDSFIKYVPRSGKTMAYKSGGIIVCSSHMSAFDPKSGAKKLSGPAEQALASIVLEIAEDDTIWATAVLGPDKFHEYFKAYKPEFKKFYGGKRKAKKLVKSKAQTITLSEYSKEIIQY